MSCDDDAFTGSASDDGDISSTDLSVEELGAKEIGTGDPSPPELGDAPPLLSGYSQTYVVRKQDLQKNQGRNRQVKKCRKYGWYICMSYSSQGSRPKLLGGYMCYARQNRIFDVMISFLKIVPCSRVVQGFWTKSNTNPVRAYYLCSLFKHRSRCVPVSTKHPQRSAVSATTSVHDINLCYRSCSGAVIGATPERLVLRAWVTEKSSRSRTSHERYRCCNDSKTASSSSVVPTGDQKNRLNRWSDYNRIRF